MRRSYLVIELAVLVFIVQLIKVVFVFIHNVILKGFASEIINGTRDDLEHLSLVSNILMIASVVYLLLEVLANLVVHLQFFFEFLELIIIYIFTLFRWGHRWREKVEK